MPGGRIKKTGPPGASFFYQLYLAVLLTSLCESYQIVLNANLYSSRIKVSPSSSIQIDSNCQNVPKINQSNLPSSYQMKKIDFGTFGDFI